MPKTIMLLLVSGVALKKDGKYLLVQEKNKAVYGKWNWPAGKVDEGESLEETAVREAKEETGYYIKLGKHIDVFHKSAQDEACKHLYQGEIVGGELKIPQAEELDAKWFTPEEIYNMKDKCRSAWVWEGVEAAEKIK